MGEFFPNTEDNPSDQLARIYDKFRSDVKSLMFAILTSIEFVHSARSPTISSFEHRDYFILDFTFSVDYVNLEIQSHIVILDTLEITVVFNIVDRKILKISVEMDGIQWDVDEEVDVEIFSSISKEIRHLLQHAIQKQALNPEILKHYELSKVKYMSQMMSHMIRGLADSITKEGINPLSVFDNSQLPNNPDEESNEGAAD